MRALVEHAFVIGGIVLCALSAVPAHGAIPADCGGTRKSIEEIEDFYFEARFQDALQALDRLPSNLAASCRDYVQSLRAQTLLKLDREDEARRVFQSALAENAAWRPDPSHADPQTVALFDRTREEWLSTRTGDFSVAPPRIDFRSQTGQVPTDKHTISIRSTGSGDINWQVKDLSPWIQLTRRSGFTSAGADSFTALLAPQRLPESATVQGGRIVVASGTYQHAVDVTWETVAAEKKKPFYTKPLFLVGGGAVVAAVVIAAAAGGGGDDGGEENPDPLPGFPPPPPSPRRGFFIGTPW